MVQLLCEHSPNFLKVICAHKPAPIPRYAYEGVRTQVSFPGGQETRDGDSGEGRKGTGSQEEESRGLETGWEVKQELEGAGRDGRGRRQKLSWMSSLQ